MKTISIDLNKEKNTILESIKILPLADLHLGDKLANLKAIKKVLEQIKNEENTYTIINGDLANVALKNSKSDTYDESLTPMQQIIEISAMLKPIKDKILVISTGNHEDRITRDTSIDIIRVVARELGIEDRYADGMWYLFLSFGKSLDKGRKITYQISGVHGNAGGRMSGGKINALERLSTVSIADLYIMSHTHKPIITKSVIYVPDEQHKTVLKKELFYLMTNSFLEYGGYAEKLALSPSNTTMTEAELSGKAKRIKLTMWGIDILRRNVRGKKWK